MGAKQVTLQKLLRVEPKPKSGIRQQDLLKKVVEVKPKQPRVLNSLNGNDFTSNPTGQVPGTVKVLRLMRRKKEHTLSKPRKGECETDEENSVKNENNENSVKSLLAITYASSDDED